VLEHTLSEEEHNQIVQTIEMFEAITQTQADDYQSLEILKEAYSKIGKHDDAMRVSRRLAEAYFNVGSYTLAMQECEVILVKEPNAADILSMLGEIESRLQASGHAIAGKSGLIQKSKTTDEPGNLVEIKKKGAAPKQQDLANRGDEHLGKFLVVQQMFDERDVSNAIGHVAACNKKVTGRNLAVSLLDHLCKDNNDLVERALSALIDRTKFAYVPLEYYDLDRQIAPMLPDHLTIGRLYVPFDLVSRTMMVACCNPFDAAGREAVEQSVDYTVAWYLARPATIVKNLQAIYRLDTRA
jgi:hypothetical protein